MIIVVVFVPSNILLKYSIALIGQSFHVNGVVALYLRSENIMVRNTDIVMLVILSLKKNNKFHFLK